MLQLQDKNPFVCGDSAVDDSKQKLEEFCDKFRKVWAIFVVIYDNLTFFKC